MNVVTSRLDRSRSIALEEHALNGMGAFSATRGITHITKDTSQKTALSISLFSYSAVTEVLKREQKCYHENLVDWWAHIQNNEGNFPETTSLKLRKTTLITLLKSTPCSNLNIWTRILGIFVLAPFEIADNQNDAKYLNILTIWTLFLTSMYVYMLITDGSVITIKDGRLKKCHSLNVSRINVKRYKNNINKRVPISLL